MTARLRAPRAAARVFGAPALLVLALGCGGAPTPIDRVVVATRATVDLLKSVTDPASATAAIPKIKPTFDELAAADSALVAMLSDPSKLLSVVSKARSAMEEMATLKTQLEAETDRIDKLKGLPVEFWNAIRVAVYKTAQVLVSGDPDDDPELVGPVQQVCSFYDQFGPQRVVEIKLNNVEMGDKAGALERLRELAGKDAQVVDLEDPDDFEVSVAVVAPVDDFDKLAKSIDFGDVVDQDKVKGEVIVDLPDAANEPAEVAADAAAPAGEVDPAATVVEDGGAPPPVEGNGAPAPGPAESAAGAFFGALSAAAQAQQAAAEAKAAAGPQPGDRDYHAQMAEFLYKPDSPHHERAVAALLEVKPAAVADKKVRARIANGYRALALGSGVHASKAVDGLVLWGGKFSAPLLIELLEKQSSGAEEAIYNGLAQVATPEAAEAVAKRLEPGAAGGEAAFACLRKMGPVAELALVGVLPLESPESNRAAIEVLGEIGTKKSTALLRKATKSENEEVKKAALDALRAIQARQAAERKKSPSPSLEGKG